MPDSTPPFADRSPSDGPALRGTNQSGMRDWNERLVLSLLRTHGALPKAEIARMTGLSAQTASVIVRELEQDNLLERGEPVRGRVGQPSVPMSLAADGAFFLGLKIGRRSSEMLLVDFHGAIRGRRIRRHEWPTPDAALNFATLAARELIDQLDAPLQARVAGMGIASPFRLWDWADNIGAPQAAMDAWRGFDLRAEVAALHGFPVFHENDATAACGAELVFGKLALPADVVHVYVGFFVGAGRCAAPRAQRQFRGPGLDAGTRCAGASRAADRHRLDRPARGGGDRRRPFVRDDLDHAGLLAGARNDPRPVARRRR